MSAPVWFSVESPVVVVVEASRGGRRWEGCEERDEAQSESRLGMAGGWSLLLKVTRSRQSQRKACWEPQEVSLLPGSRQ